ncbi:MAG: segregation/condensation protein A [Bdellovibrionaceae bacterium]|nr:segregation/condensation protein A [Bdellovibrionales bacterium]MCB9083751.1 segregation/condensation protein A [Pseudobdellovibrionaceae bacterium]
MSLVIQLERFEGPLGLLLHLIRREEMDIFDINIHEITRQYLDFIKSMKKLDLENAGDFVSMAASLIQIKSKMLLPQYNEDGEEIEQEDPRKELVAKLLEYQKYQDAAHRLYDRPLVGRDVYLRGERMDLESEEEGEIIVEDNALFALISAYRAAIRGMKKGIHKVSEALQSISERILEIKDRLVVGRMLGFFEFIDGEKRGEARSSQVLVTFISLLELAKMGFVSLFQADDKSEIRIEAKHMVDGDVISTVEDYDNAHASEVAMHILEEAEAEHEVPIDLEAAAEKLMEEASAEVIQQQEDELADAATDEEILAEEMKLDEEDRQRGHELGEELGEEIFLPVEAMEPTQDGEL